MMMNSIKKYLSLLLTLVLLISSMGVSALAEEITEGEVNIVYDEETGEELVYDEEGNLIEFPDELRVGHPTITKGDFFTEMFGNDTADIDVRALLHAYNLVNWDQNQGVYLIDESVVEDVMVMENDIGDRTYFLALYDDLYYSDGTPITAWDYAFSLLLMMSPEIEQIGGKIYRAEHIVGYDEYITGKVPYLEGVGVIDEHQLAITLDHEFLPYFFETGLLLCVPYPISVIAPGCRVYSDGATDLGDGYGYGIYIGNEDLSVEEPIYTAELLEKTILDPDTGYNSHPSVTSGPYKLLDYDYVTAHFEINDYYKGAWVYNTLPDNFEFNIKELAGTGSGALRHNSHSGPNIYKVDRESENGEENPMYLIKPTIEHISFTVADNDTMAQDLADGTFHLVNKVVYAPTIRECLGIGSDDEAEETEEIGETTEEDSEPQNDAPDMTGITFDNYPRIGLAFLTFTYDWPTVHDKEVRQAIAWCMDRDALTHAYCGDYGQVVNGYYGIEQWEYLICTHQLDYPINFINDETHTDEDLEEWGKHRNMYATTDEEYDALVAAWELLSLENLVNYNVYDLENDPERTEKVGIVKANALLDSAGWTLNREGGKYDPEVDDVRCKMVDDELVALDLTLMYPAGNHIIDTMQENFFDNLEEVGIKITLVPEEMEELLKSYYREKERTTDMIYLATNFHVIVDPSITYSTDKTANHLIWNNTYSDDEDLYWRAVNMRKTDPQDVYDYVSKWISFQERYNEVLPCIPLYSNIYFDFYTEQLQNYHITGHVTWSQAILESYFGVAAPEEDVPEDYLGDDDVEVFDD
jgi:ABC-type transport system substrate-binding protein